MLTTLPGWQPKARRGWKEALFERPRPRLRLSDKTPPRDPYKRDRKTLRFEDEAVERQFRDLHHKQSLETTRILALMLVLIGLASVVSAVLGSLRGSKQGDWYLFVIRVVITVVPLPQVFALDLPCGLANTVWTLVAISLYYAVGFFSLLETTENCATEEGDDYKNFVGGQFTLFLATAVVASSGVFLFPVTLAVTSLALLASFILYFTVSGILGNTCWRGGCLMNASYLAYHVILFVLSIASAYYHENRQRQRFALAHRLRLLAAKIAKMELEGAEAILLASQNSKDWEDAEETARLLSIIRHLKQYRPFLPESLFLELGSPTTTSEDRPAPEGVAIGLIDHDAAHHDPPPSPHPPGRSKQDQRFGVELRELAGTCLIVHMDLEGLPPSRVQEFDEGFLEIVMASAHETEGMVLSFGAGYAALTWNTHHSHPQHHFTACRCALHILKKVKRAIDRPIAMAVATGQVLAGITGTSKKKSSVVMGPPMRQASRLVMLNELLKTTILLTQPVYEVVQSSFTAHMVDVVLLEKDTKPMRVYELAGFRGPEPPGSEHYKLAFAEFCNGRVIAALEHLERYFAALPSGVDPQPVRQATRLWRAAYYRSTHPVLGAERYCRQDGWEHVDKEGAALALPTRLTNSLAPYLSAEVEEEADDLGLGEETEEDMAVKSLEVELAMFDDSNVTRKSAAVEKTFVDMSGQTWYLSSQLLGKGGFGEVYLGMSDNGKLVAVKAMDIARENADEYVNEIKLLMKFRHPNIVGYLGSAIHKSKLMIVMEYVPCGSLDKIIERFRDNLTVSSSRRYIRDILRGLDYLHVHAVVHRDIKPENVLMTADGECKVADFGTAGTINPDENMVKGTPHYMAPEVFQGKGTGASDIWSFGVTALQLMTTETGCPLECLRDKSQIMAVMYTLSQLTEPPPLPATLPAVARSFLTPCFAIDPTQRPTASQLLSEPFCL